MDQSISAWSPPATGRFLAAISRFHPAWFDRRKAQVLFLLLLALAPLFYVFWRTVEARRDIIYWDEFDTALAFVLKLREGTTPGEFLRDLFALNNEHRMVTSRLLFAGSFWITEKIDFALLHWIGNGTILAMCGLLVATAGTGLRRLRLGLLLALLLFQLESFENFLWSGSSIDHFQVILLAAGAIVALSRGTRTGPLAGGLIAALATFTLSHGIAVWPVGAAMLWWAGRKREFALWCAIGLLAVGSFFIGFQTNAAESFVSLSFAGALKVTQYWLSILGAAPALGNAGAAPYLGAALLLLQVYVSVNGAVRRERIALPLAAFAILAAGLIAIGRAEHSGGQVHSRYCILSALAWALGIFMLVERHTHPRRPLRVLGALLPSLAMFNVFANREFSDETEAWLTCRELAAISFKQHGADGHGTFHLYPVPQRSSSLLARAEALGVYHLGPICLAVPFPEDARESAKISYYFDEIKTTRRSASVRGWAGFPGQASRRGSVHLILRSAEATHVFTAVTEPRPDLPAVLGQKGWLNAGFHFARNVASLPAGDFQIGLLIKNGRRAEYIMTGRRLKIGGGENRSAAAEEE